jgi:uncharacterized repeat protein (TIGR03803 family)
MTRRRVAAALLLVAGASVPRANAGAPALLYSFTASGDGAKPVAGLTAGPGGALYGAACLDTEVSDAGTIFQLSPPAAGQAGRQFKVLYSFPSDNSAGNCPIGTLLPRPDGSLIGTTESGGAGGFGTVFQLVPPSERSSAWTETVLHAFPLSRGDGATLYGGVIADQQGNLYGTTVQGGRGCHTDLGCGTVFEVKPPTSPSGPWTETVLHFFVGRTGQAGFPSGDLLLQGKTLIGTTPQGVFTLAPPASGHGAWRFQMLAVSPALPGLVATGVTAGADGTLYAMAGQGGSNDTGAIFALHPPATEGAPWSTEVLHDFGPILGNADGMYPSASMTIGARGTLFGTVPFGSANERGAAFRLDPPARQGGAWTYTVLASFGAAAAALGNTPLDKPLLRGATLWLTNSAGGADQDGAIVSVGTH